jgi:hypothetical protein
MHCQVLDWPGVWWKHVPHVTFLALILLPHHHFEITTNLMLPTLVPYLIKHNFHQLQPMIMSTTQKPQCSLKLNAP